MNFFAAWDDGKIRGYGFACSKEGGLVEKFVRGEAHSKGVTAVAVMSDGHGIVSGGGEGQVRIWKLVQTFARGKDVLICKLEDTMMEHKGSVSDIKITKNDKECVSASTDGTCIIWDLL